MSNEQRFEVGGVNRVKLFDEEHEKRLSVIDDLVRRSKSRVNTVPVVEGGYFFAELVALFGPSNAGKTIILTATIAELCGELSLSHDFRGRRIVHKRPLKALYVTYENSPADIDRMIRCRLSARYRDELGLAVDPDDIQHNVKILDGNAHNDDFPNGIRTTDKEAMDLLADWCIAHDIAIVAFDTLTSSQGYTEERGFGAAEVQTTLNCRRLILKTGCLVFVTHHPSQEAENAIKAGAVPERNHMRGPTALPNSLDHIEALFPNYELEKERLKENPDATELQLVLTEVKVRNGRVSKHEVLLEANVETTVEHVEMQSAGETVEFNRSRFSGFTLCVTGKRVKGKRHGKLEPEKKAEGAEQIAVEILRAHPDGIAEKPFLDALRSRRVTVKNDDTGRRFLESLAQNEGIQRKSNGLTGTGRRYTWSIVNG